MIYVLLQTQQRATNSYPADAWQPAILPADLAVQQRLLASLPASLALESPHTLLLPLSEQNRSVSDRVHASQYQARMIGSSSCGTQTQRRSSVPCMSVAAGSCMAHLCAHLGELRSEPKGRNGTTGPVWPPGFIDPESLRKYGLRQPSCSDTV